MHRTPPDLTPHAAPTLSPTSLFADFASERILHAGVASAMGNSPPWATPGRGGVQATRHPLEAAASARSFLRRVNTSGDQVTRAELTRALRTDSELGDDDRQAFGAALKGMGPGGSDSHVAADEFVNLVLLHFAAEHGGGGSQRAAAAPSTQQQAQQERAAVLSEAETTRAQMARLAMQVEHNMSLTESSIRRTLPGAGSDLRARTVGWGDSSSTPGPQPTGQQGHGTPERTVFVAPGGLEEAAAGSPAGRPRELGEVVYPPAYVDDMQAQHRERIGEAMAAASRLISVKDEQLTEVLSRSKANDATATARETLHQRQLDELRGELKDAEEAHQRAKAEMERQFTSELTELKLIRSEELQRLRRQHEDELDELRSECEEQLAAVEANRVAVTARLSSESTDCSRVTAQAKELAKIYQAQVAQMDEMLQKESLRCQELQEQLLELEVQKNNSQLQAQAELADMGRRMQEAEDMAGKCQKQAKKAVLKALDSEAAGRREGELRAAAVNQEEEWAAKLKRKEKEIQRLKKRNQELITAAATATSTFEQDLRRQLAVYETQAQGQEQAVKMAESQQHQVHDLMKLNRALQRDVRVAQNELKLTESETERLRDDNLDLRDEVARLDNLIYGRAGVMASGSAAQRRGTGPAKARHSARHTPRHTRKKAASRVDSGQRRHGRTSSPHNRSASTHSG